MVSRLKALAARLLCLSGVGELLRLLQGGRVRSLRFPGISLSMPRTLVRAEIVASFFWGIYESAEMRFVRDHLRSDRDVVELGASIGSVSAAIGQRLEPGRRLVSVEANPALTELLRRNIAANAPHLVSRVVNAAIDYESDEVVFVEAIDNKGGQVAQPADDTQKTVPALRLGELLDEHGIDRFSLVSDIEGGEIGIIENDPEALARCDQIVIELHDVVGGVGRATVDGLIYALQTAHGFELRARRGMVCVFDRPASSASA